MSERNMVPPQMYTQVQYTSNTLKCKLCSLLFVKIMNKTSKMNKLLMVTDLIFSNNLQADAKILMGFCCGNFQVGLQKYITATSYMNFMAVDVILLDFFK